MKYKHNQNLDAEILLIQIYNLQSNAKEFLLL